jgi:hypothetical protein
VIKGERVLHMPQDPVAYGGLSRDGLVSSINLSPGCGWAVGLHVWSLKSDARLANIMDITAATERRTTNAFAILQRGLT